MKKLILASAAGLAIAACTGADTDYADADDAVVTTPAERVEVLSAETPAPFLGEIRLTELLNADIVGSDGEEFTDVEDVFIRNARVQGISFDADAAFGGKRYAEFGSLTFLADDGLADEAEFDIMIPRTEDSFDDFDLIDENVDLTPGDAGTDMLERDVRVSGLDDVAEIEDVIFNTDGTVAYYIVDEGLGEEPVRVEPYKVAFVTDTEIVADTLDEDYLEADYEDTAASYDSDDYSPDRK